MLITLQFPLFDLRYLRPEVVRITRPDWSAPGPKDQVRYMGSIIDRESEYRGPWDGESKYCAAHKVFNFCGEGPDHFYPQFYQNTKILYRRLQSDGNSLIQFQIGLYDKSDLESNATYKKIEERIEKYLALKVKIRIGNKLTDFVSLAECGQYLKEAYFWATTKGPKSFKSIDLKHQIEEGDPMILVEYNSSNLTFPDTDYNTIENKSIKKSGLKLQHGLFVNKISEHKSKSLPLWLIGHQSDQAIVKSDYKYFSNQLRHLRINLMRVHSECFVMKRIGDFTNNPRELQNLKDPVVRQLIAILLLKQFENISKVRRFNYPQEEILGLVYSSDPGQTFSRGLENLIQESERAYNWLVHLTSSEDLKSYIEQIKDYYRQIKSNIDPQTPEICFSYAWGDENQKENNREKIVDELSLCLSKNKYKFKRDKVDSKYGTLISEFMKQIGKSYLVIVFLSDKYLKSTYCMYELYEIYRNNKLEEDPFINKIILIHTEQIDFTKSSDYENYWNTKKADDNISKEEKERISEIAHYFSTLFDILKDINAKTVDILKQNDFELVRKTIDERLGL